MDDNILVEINVNQNTSTKVNMRGSGAAVIGDGTNTIVNANVVHHFYQRADMPSSERGGTSVDVRSSARPSRLQCPLLPIAVVPPEVELVCRSMKIG